jgi:virulence factor
MNRDGGTTEERLEVFAPAEKRVVINVSELIIQKDSNIQKIGFNDWEPTLHKRGFHQMVDDFLQAVSGGTKPEISAEDALLTHQMCENIVKKLESQG